MNLPILIKQIYGSFTFTGLYSFEFVDKNRNTIVEIFFMNPPKTKYVSEGTRASINPTFGGNYILDGGNSVKSMTITGDLFFAHVGSPDNPTSNDNAGLQNTIDGLNEFLKIQFMLIRYRDYTLSKKANIKAPDSVMSVSKEIATLYKEVSKKIKSKIGALYDEVKLIVHDYDMNDHFYCRVSTFSSNLEASRYAAVNYNIELECYEPDVGHKPMQVRQVKNTSNEQMNSTNELIQNLNFDDVVDDIKRYVNG